MLKDLEKKSKSNKGCRVNYNKIIAYFDLLQEYGVFVVLHYFIKKTQKTPRRELDKAKRNLDIYRSRRESNGNMEEFAE